MALTAFKKRKLDAIRDRVSHDTSAVDDARAEAHIEGYAAASKAWQLEMARLREELSLAQERVASFRKLVTERDAENSHLRVARKEEKTLLDAAKVDIALLKAAVETLKAEVTKTRMASREPRKAAVTECLDILKRERTVARSEAVLRKMLGEL